MRYFKYDKVIPNKPKVLKQKKEKYYYRNQIVGITAFCVYLLLFILVNIFSTSIIINSQVQANGFVKTVTLISALIGSVVIPLPFVALILALSKESTIHLDEAKQLREFYGIGDDYVVTKCYDSSEKPLNFHDLCVFKYENELRLTTDLTHEAARPDRDLGCYAIPLDELKYDIITHNAKTAIRIEYGKFYVILAKKAIKMFTNDKHVKNTNLKNGASSISPKEKDKQYPRLCAHRGFSAVAPENTLPAFGAAVALGADEIEFDLWSTSDGVIVSCHDSKLDRVSTGEGKIFEHTYAELLELDFGIKYGEKFAGLKIATFEEILEQFACRVIMNIHVKIWDVGCENNKLEEIVALIRKYECEEYCYFMSRNDEMLKKAMEYAPKIRCCVGLGTSRGMLDLPNRAIAIGAHKVQLFKPYFNEETVKLAHENGILCNVFWADDPEEARKYLEMGIDTILTNDYLKVYNGVKDLLKGKSDE